MCEGLVMVLAAVLYDVSFGVDLCAPDWAGAERVLRSTIRRVDGSRTREACGWATTVALQAKEAISGEGRRGGLSTATRGEENGSGRRDSQVRKMRACLHTYTRVRAHTITQTIPRRYFPVDMHTTLTSQRYHAAHISNWRRSSTPM